MSESRLNSAKLTRAAESAAGATSVRFADGTEIRRDLDATLRARDIAMQEEAVTKRGGLYVPVALRRPNR